MAETAAIYTNKAAPKTTTNLETRRKREREREIYLKNSFDPSTILKSIGFSSSSEKTTYR
jgi:hypothetical protein